MKKQYSTPNLTTHGDVADITQVLGSSNRTDFIFFSGSPQSGGNDIGSVDEHCTGKNQSNPGTCTFK